MLTGCPDGYLENFYGEIGCVRAEELEVSEFLRERIGEYHKLRPDKKFVIMKCYGRN